MIRKVIFFCVAFLCSVAAVYAAEGNKTSITIYSKAQPGSLPPEMYRPTPGMNSWGYGQIPGYATVRQTRPVALNGKRSEIRIADVAALIDPTTVSFKSLTDPEGTRVLEQNYQFDLVSGAKLLERYIGETITVEQFLSDKIESVSGKLLSASGGLILETEGGKVVTLQSYSNIKFPELPGGLITKPTLVWDIATSKPGAHEAEISYQTGGMTWWTDYNLTYTDGKDANSGTLDVGAWVSIANKSGASYKDSKLKLVAGDVQRVETSGRGNVMYEMAAAAPKMADAVGFQEKAFFEYHLYTLGRPTTLPDNSTKQIELFPKAAGVPAEKKYVYYGSQGYHYYGSVSQNRDLGIPMNKKVDVYLTFKNEEENGLGIPLPAGRIRVSKLDPEDGSLEFIGEDIIDHTPKDEKIQVKLGSAFDVVGERKQTDFKVDVARRWIEESFEVILRNHKQEAVNVLVKENLYRAANWKITENSDDFEKQDAFTIHFPVTVPKDDEKTIRYTVEYTW